MIADLDRSIEKLLIAELPISNGEIDVKFDQPSREWSARLSRPTLNLFLYDVRENHVLRQHQWERVMVENSRQRQNGVSQKRSPYRIDLLYMLTGWATEPQDEHRLLSRAMLALFRYPIFPSSHLTGEMENQPFKIQTRLASHDRLTNPAELWGSMDNEIRPSVSYLITVAMDPWAPVTGPAVRTYTFSTGQATRLPFQKSLDDGTVSSQTFIGGQVTNKEEPQPDIQVAIKGTGYFATTNEEGQFVLGDLPHGDHTLVIWPAEGKPVEKQITVPSETYDIEI